MFDRMDHKPEGPAKPAEGGRGRIAVLFWDRDFEHDVYELIRAFYPGYEMHSLYGDEPAAQDYAYFFSVSRTGTDYTIKCRCPEGCDEALARLEPVGETPDLALRKENKDRIKSALYVLLTRMTQKTLPWGSLTGIRPAKLAMGMLEAGIRNVEIAAAMREKYFVSNTKTALAVTIANREKALLSGFNYADGYSLYVGIPFCPSICLYCSFSSFPIGAYQAKVEPYLDALFYEAGETARIMKESGRRLDTIYIGGGTPTTLTADQLRRLLLRLRDTFGYDGIKEFTVEAGRPDSITVEKLKALREFPVTRISVNPQTMNQETLDLIGRRHTVSQTREAFALARDCGFEDINMDIIVGLPGETGRMVSHTLDEISSLGPDSLTVHTLAVKRAARLNIFKEQYQEMTFEANQEIMEMCQEAAAAMGMGPYYMYRQKNMKGNFENVGYAREGKSCLYNVLIMEEKQPIVAIGAGGACKLVYPDGSRVERVENVKDVKNYIERTAEMVERKRQAIAALTKANREKAERS